METELSSEFEARVAKHAALADPLRLRIVDLLTFGDYSPMELRQTLGLPGNLLSHHLQALESAGLVNRRRSEADKRRMYVHLVPGSLENLMPQQLKNAQRILFVCTHNSARSQLAAALWDIKSDLPSASAGTHPSPHVAEGAVAAAQRHGLTLENTTPKHLDEVLTEHDFVVTVCDNAHEELANLPQIHWSIPDPLTLNTPQAFEDAFRDIAERIGSLAPRIEAPHPRKTS